MGASLSSNAFAGLPIGIDVGAGGLKRNSCPQRGHLTTPAPCTSAAENVFVQSGFGQCKTFTKGPRLSRDLLIRLLSETVRRTQEPHGDARVHPMADQRDVHVHLLPELAPVGRLAGGVAVVIDVLRATTTIVYALAAGCREIRPCADVDEARHVASELPAGKVLLAGERGGLPLEGFDLGNSPREFTAKSCAGQIVVLTTTNGTRALVRAAESERVLVAAFVNFSAVCEQLRHERRPVQILCAGYEGEPAIEDILLAGAMVDCICDEEDVRLNDSARLAWDAFENHGQVLQGAFEIAKGGAHLISLGFAADIAAALEIDKFTLVPELYRDPLRLEVGSVGIVKSCWRK